MPREDTKNGTNRLGYEIRRERIAVQLFAGLLAKSEADSAPFGHLAFAKAPETAIALADAMIALLDGGYDSDDSTCRDNGHFVENTEKPGVS